MVMPSASRSPLGSASAVTSAAGVASDGQNLLAVVLPAVGARGVRQLHLPAGAVRATHQRRRGGLPLGPARAGVAARHLAFGNGHGSYSDSSLFVGRKAA